MKYLLLVLMLISFLIGKTQVNAGPDQIICIGETTSLQGSGSPSFTYTWTSDPEDLTISNPNILNPTVQPLVSTDYTLEGRSVSISNLVVDGNFESGTNNNFTSSYTYSPGPNGLWNEGTYAVTTDASYNHNNFTCNNDHTTGNGYFMAVNGAQTQNVVVWSTSVTGISPNTEYEFSTWIASLSGTNPATLQFRINGILLGQPFNASSITCEWFKFFEKWNSGSSTSADISIVNQNTIGNGNDFSLDDINFSKVTYYSDECTITVTNYPTSNFDLPAESCSSDTVIVNYSGTSSSTAIYGWDFGSATVHSGSGAGPYSLTWSVAGLQNVSLHVDDYCLSDTTINSINIHQTPTSSVTAYATTIPYGTNDTLNGVMTGNPGPLTFEWDPAEMLVDPNIQDPVTINLQNSTLFTFTTTDQSSQCTSFDTITIYVTGGPLTILSLVANHDTICLGDSANLVINIEGGSGNYTSTWSSDPPGFNYTGTETQVTVYPTDSTTYFVEVYDGFNTTPLSSTIVMVLPQIEVFEQPVDSLIEDGQTAIFSVSAINETNYQWQVSVDNGTSWLNLSDDNTYSGSDSSVLTVSNALENMSSYLYRCLLGGLCDPVESESAELTVILSPNFIGQLDDVETCQNDTAFIPCLIENFIEIDSFSLAFSFDTTILQFSHLINLRPELSALSVYQEGDSIVLHWDSPIGANINDGIFFEFGFTAISGGEDSVIWNSNSIVKNSYGFFPDLQISSANIIIIPLPEEPDYITATPDSLNILDEIDIDFEAIGGSGNYILWTQDSCGGDSIGNGVEISLFRPEQTTAYFANWINQCGMSECKEVVVKIIKKYSFNVPTAFTPNGDGNNDKFGIISPSTLPVFELYIYNRWGQQIFNSNDQYDLWDGTYNGELSPLGVYVWKSTYQYRIEGQGSEVHQESGTVTLLK